MIDQGDKSVNGLVNLQLFYFFSFLSFYLFIFSLLFWKRAWLTQQMPDSELKMSNGVYICSHHCLSPQLKQLAHKLCSLPCRIHIMCSIIHLSTWVNSGNLQHDEMCSSWKCLLSWFGPKLIWSVGSGSLISLLIKSFSSWGRAKRQVSVK